MGTLPETNLGSTPEEKEGAAAGRIARFREETRGQRIGIAQEAEERFKKYITWGAKLDGVTKRFNPGGGGRGGDDRRSVMIRRWMRRHRGRREQRAEGSRKSFRPRSRLNTCCPASGSGRSPGAFCSFIRLSPP